MKLTQDRLRLAWIDLGLTWIDLDWLELAWLGLYWLGIDLELTWD